MLIIGDEILSGFTQEQNLAVASRELAAIGIPLARVVVVPDSVDEIVDELRRMAMGFDVVITSGGIGPTHDDVTIKGGCFALLLLAFTFFLFLLSDLHFFSLSFLLFSALLFSPLSSRLTPSPPSPSHLFPLSSSSPLPACLPVCSS